ncbi:MAG: hypothetical protein SFZ03_09900 [Candidatus Melainabacteria bacterium]|nr:hypothetical protein [Candidatus Melainabacteria bacterium]
MIVNQPKRYLFQSTRQSVSSFGAWFYRGCFRWVCFWLLLLGVFCWLSPDGLARSHSTKTYPKRQPAAASATLAQPGASSAPVRRKPAPARLSLQPSSQDTRQQLDQLEQQLIGAHFPSESVAERLDRLEQLVFGQTSPQFSPNVRLQKLSSASGHFSPEEPHASRGTAEHSDAPADRPGLDRSSGGRVPPSAMPAEEEGRPSTASSPSAQHFPQQDGQYDGQYQNQHQSQHQGPNGTAQPSFPSDATDYPSVSALERQQFGRDFAQEPLEVRLNRLELTLYGQTLPGSLVDRVDRLRPYVTQPITTAEIPGDWQNQGQPLPPSVQDRLFPGALGAPPPSISRPIVPSLPPGMPLPPYLSNGVNGAGVPYGQPPSPPDFSPVEGVPPEDPQAGLVAEIARLEYVNLKQAFPNEPPERRVERLEVTLFGKPAPPDIALEDRVARIQAVSVADKGGEMQSNQKMLLKKMVPIIIMMLPLLL